MKNGSTNVPMNIILKQIVKTTQEWALVESIIPKDVLCIETCADGLQLQKLGDGVNTFANLPYMVSTFTGASTRYDLVTEEPVEFDPTAYYKLVDTEYVPGEEGDEWATDTWYTKVEVAGKRGLVPAPAAGAGDKFLRGDGTWADVSTTDTQYRIFYDSAASALDAFTLQANDGSGWVDVTDVNLNLFNENTTIIRSALLPSYVDDIVEGYYYNEAFYEDDAHTTRIEGESGKIYVDIDTSSTYRCVPAAYVLLTEEPTEDQYTLVTEEPADFDPTAYYKLVEGEYVPGEVGDEWAADTWYSKSTVSVFDPTEYYKLVDDEYVPGEVGDTWAEDTWYDFVDEVWVNISNPMSPEAICSLLGITYSASAATIGDMVGADGTDPGVHGFVPAPAATDNTKFLKGSGTYGDAVEPTDNLTLQCVLAFE